MCGWRCRSLSADPGPASPAPPALQTPPLGAQTSLVPVGAECAGACRLCGEGGPAGEGPRRPPRRACGKPGVPGAGQGRPRLPHRRCDTSTRVSSTGQETRPVPPSGTPVLSHRRGGETGLAPQRERASHQPAGAPSQGVPRPAFVPSARGLPSSPGIWTPQIHPLGPTPHPCRSHTFLRTLSVTNDGTPNSTELKHKRDIFWLVHLDPAVSDTAGPRGWDDRPCSFPLSPTRPAPSVLWPLGRVGLGQPLPRGTRWPPAQQTQQTEAVSVPVLPARVWARREPGYGPSSGLPLKAKTRATGPLWGQPVGTWEREGATP